METGPWSDFDLEFVYQLAWRVRALAQFLEHDEDGVEFGYVEDVFPTTTLGFYEAYWAKIYDESMGRP